MKKRFFQVFHQTFRKLSCLPVGSKDSNIDISPTHSPYWWETSCLQTTYDTQTDANVNYVIYFIIFDIKSLTSRKPTQHLVLMFCISIFWQLKFSSNAAANRNNNSNSSTVHNANVWRFVAVAAVIHSIYFVHCLLINVSTNKISRVVEWKKIRIVEVSFPYRKKRRKKTERMLLA